MLSGPWKVKYVPHSDIGGEGYICLCTQLFVCTVLLSEQCTQIIFYHFKPLCINDINYNYATAAFLSALCHLSLFTSWHLQQEACINQIYKYTNRMMSIIHLSVVLIFLLSGACLGCISRVTVDFSTLNKMFTENFFENKILNHSLVALTWGFFFMCVFAAVWQAWSTGRWLSWYGQGSRCWSLQIIGHPLIHRYQILIFIVFVLL